MRGLAPIALLLLSCNTPKQAAFAAGTAAVAVAAAAVHRAATDSCWGSCGNGYICDRQTGMCELPPETEEVRAMSARQDAGCIEEDDGRIVCPDDPALETSAPPADPCQGLCVGEERCVVREGVADCLAGPE
jgi:hypothetical protein